MREPGTVEKVRSVREPAGSAQRCSRKEGAWARAREAELGSFPEYSLLLPHGVLLSRESEHSAEQGVNHLAEAIAGTAFPTVHPCRASLPGLLTGKWRLLGNSSLALGVIS